MNRLACVVATLAILVPPSFTEASSKTRYGIEVGGHYSMLDPRDASLPGFETNPRLLPSVGFHLDRPITERLSVRPSVRYAQQGNRSSWHWESYAGGTDETREHVLSGGVGLRCEVVGPFFLTMTPELSYLMSGELKQSAWVVYRPTTRGEDQYAARSDRWNPVIRIGVGSMLSSLLGQGSIQVRYVRGVNDMTRITRPFLSSSQRNIAWTATEIPMERSEWRTEGVEALVGWRW